MAAGKRMAVDYLSSYRVPLDERNWFVSVCVSIAVSPDLFIVDPMNVVIAVASDEMPPNEGTTEIKRGD